LLLDHGALQHRGDEGGNLAHRAPFVLARGLRPCTKSGSSGPSLVYIGRWRGFLQNYPAVPNEKAATPGGRCPGVVVGEEVVAMTVPMADQSASVLAVAATLNMLGGRIWAATPRPTRFMSTTSTVVGRTTSALM